MRPEMSITFVLYRPEHPGNIGSIARAAANFGFKDIVLVDPQSDINLEARNLAKRAQDTLAGMKTVDEIPSFDTLVMTQGRDCTDHNMVRSGIAPRQLSERLSELDLKEYSVGILFGPEGEGIEPELLRKADIVVTIPTTEEYPSMNLAMSVTVMLYELSHMSGERKIDEVFEPMSGEEKKAMLDLVDECLDQWDFPSDSARETLKLAWLRMVGRSFLTKREAMAIMGFLKRCHGKR